MNACPRLTRTPGEEVSVAREPTALESRGRDRHPYRPARAISGRCDRDSGSAGRHGYPTWGLRTQQVVRRFDHLEHRVVAGTGAPLRCRFCRLVAHQEVDALSHDQVDRCGARRHLEDGSAC